MAPYLHFATDMTQTARHTRIAFVAIIIATMVMPASAQYFGRNKVQYKKLPFEVLKTAHFDIYFYAAERAGVDIAARMAERWLARLERLLAHQLRGRQPLVLYASHPDFEQTNTIEGELSEGTGGVTEPLRRRIILPLGGPLADTDHVIGHELVHAFQFDMTTSADAALGRNGAERLPLWFIEGMAEYLSIGPVDSNTAMWLRDAARGADTLPSIEDLDKPQYFPYRWGQAFWAYVGGRFGDDVVRRMLVVAGAAGDANVAIEKVLGIKTKDLSAQWQEAILTTYAPMLASATPPAEIGQLVIKSADFSGDLNVGPSISPDARWIAFLSTRSALSIDLFLAETATGRIVHRLTSTATNPHFSSIQFIYSAGAWDFASERIAIATVVSGRPALAIFTAASGDKRQEIAIPDLDEIFNPTWAPDGRAICFTGMAHGLTDLYVYDLTSSTMRRLTSDPYAELQPAWSPDGLRIAFATDRFTSDLTSLSIGNYRLAVIDPATRAVEQVEGAAGGKNINPQWTPDSAALLFVSDRDGTPNLYRATLNGGAVTPVTRVGTGVSGITASSPAISVASRSGVAAFSVYSNGKYDIYTLENAERERQPEREAGTNPAALPPLDRKSSDVQALLKNSAFGLPASANYPREVYKPSLALEGLTQPSIAVGADRFGAAIGGGIAFQFSDLLRDHRLAAAFQINSGLSNHFSAKNTAAQVLYLNQAHRWNWGLVVGQVPYLSGGFQSGLATIDDQPAQVDQSIIFRQTERSAAGMATYPLNRAQRLEFQAGVSRLSFDQVVDTQAFSLTTGQILRDDSIETTLADPLTLATTSAAFVHDTSNFGATSPVAGQRYRLEAAPAFGAIKYTSVLADYRQYFMPIQFYTLATRIMHYGRYGAGSEDTRLFPLFVGYPNLVRGYDVGTLSSAGCTGTSNSCVEFDRLLGSRMLIGNLELRFPLLRPFGASQRMYGPVPVELALFADGGVAWSRGETPSILGGTRPGVGSAGVALRVNLFGFAVGQFDFARPFQRPTGGWVFQFNLSPGF